MEGYFRNEWTGLPTGLREQHGKDRKMGREERGVTSLSIAFCRVLDFLVILKFHMLKNNNNKMNKDGAADRENRIQTKPN